MADDVEMKNAEKADGEAAKADDATMKDAEKTDGEAAKADDAKVKDEEKAAGEAAKADDAKMGDEEKADGEAAKADDAKMKDGEKAEEEAAEEQELKPPEEPKELEEDAAPISGARLQAGSVSFLTEDTTINVMPVVGGKLLTTLSDGGFQYLLAGARANTGIKAGRYMFEVMIASSNTATLSDEPCPTGKAPKPSQLVRVGLSTGDASLVLSDSKESVCFDSEGFFIHGNHKRKASQSFVHGQVVAVLLNLDPTSPNSDTVSLFVDGKRVSEPQPLPEALKGRALYPAVSYRKVALRVNFGTVPLRPLPFKCLTLLDAAQAHCEIKFPAKAADEKCQVVMPVGVPDEGTFDWLDMFLSQNKGYVEISDRAILDWAHKSGLPRNGGYRKNCSNDKPKANFGLPFMDDMSVRRIISAIAPAFHRNYVVMEVKGNLLAEERKEVLARFAGPDFKKVAHVTMGEPPAEFKSYVQELLLKDKVVKAEAEARSKKAEANKKKEKVAEPDEEIKVELTEDEKKLCFRKKDVPDLAAKELAISYAKFTLPEMAEGFDEVTYLWGHEAQCKDFLRAWVLEKKLTQCVEELVPSDLFKARWDEWSKFLVSLKKQQRIFKDPAARKAALAAKKKEEEEKKNKAEEAKKASEEGGEDGKEEEPETEPAKEINAEDLEDVFSVTNVMDIGNGEPLFANFVYEDWQLLSIRFELHLLLHAFKHDLDDPDRPSFHERHFNYYYSKYFKKTFNLQYYGVAKLSELVELIPDIVNINSKTSMLEAQLSDDTQMDKFVKFTEEHRRSRQHREEAGDETARLHFKKPPPPTAPQPSQPAKGTGRSSTANGGRPAAQPSAQSSKGYQASAPPHHAEKRPPPSGSGYPPAQRPRTDSRDGSRTGYRDDNSRGAASSSRYSNGSGGG
eukprot:CAMPEP_0180609066 /NCGR_PEP_ID=MMETSP1037_2-20121125/28564_1 /TAXON_ID=632150 /ORGANISM="Azadinium spinosum, Strain 3D9" /LENGTH=905 /DNA_ID=CAMNT_0022628445 /DNA_START=58 /DNA_END=2771 /DNA_ORIENTATION=-